jgi:hypothetical protein
MGSRKYLCEFRDHCPDFNKLNIICRDKPWICGYWKIYFEDLRNSIKSESDSYTPHVLQHDL